jgi:hypothetical protein
LTGLPQDGDVLAQRFAHERLGLFGHTKPR